MYIYLGVSRYSKDDVEKATKRPKECKEGVPPNQGHSSDCPCARFRRIPSQFSSLPFLSDFLVRPTRNSNEGERSPNSLVKFQCLHEIRYSLFYFLSFFFQPFFAVKNFQILKNLILLLFLLHLSSSAMISL